MNSLEPVLLFGPIGPPEMIIIFVAVLLLFGAKRLPQLARSMGKSMGEFRRAKEEFESEIREAGREIEDSTSLETNPRGRRTSDHRA